MTPAIRKARVPQMLAAAATHSSNPSLAPVALGAQFAGRGQSQRAQGCPRRQQQESPGRR
eukprot:10682936-Prorocentrum_lima.AAC.1